MLNGWSHISKVKTTTLVLVPQMNKCKRVALVYDTYANYCFSCNSDEQERQLVKWDVTLDFVEIVCNVLYQIPMYALALDAQYVYVAYGNGVMAKTKDTLNQTEHLFNGLKATSVRLTDDFVCAGSSEGSIDIWNKQTTTLIARINTGSPVICLTTSQKALFARLENGHISKKQLAVLRELHNQYEEE